MASFAGTWSGLIGPLNYDKSVVEEARYRPTSIDIPKVSVSTDAWNLFNSNKDILYPFALTAARIQDPNLMSDLNKLSDMKHGDKYGNISNNLKSTIGDFVSTISDAYKVTNGGSNSASYGVAGSPASAEEIVSERKPFNFDGAPITSAVSGIEDQENRLNAWTEMMANSAHQREVQDLIKAGLNPVLSARYGGSDSGNVFAGEATSAPAAMSGSGRTSRSGFLGLMPVSNPRTPLQMAYNLVIANGDKFVHAAKQIANAASKME